jgi:hypothetical protein
VEKIGGRYVDVEAFASLKGAIVSVLTRHHEGPACEGLNREASQLLVAA